MSSNYRIASNRVDNLDVFISGDTLRFSVDFQIAENFLDPTDVFVKFRDPNNSVTIVVFTGVPIEGGIFRESDGKYYIDKTVSLPGEWWIRWEGVGIVNGVEERSFRVIRSEVIG